MKGAGMLAAALLFALPAAAQVGPASLRFPVRPGVMDGVARHKAVRLAVPDDAPPFAWTALDGRPQGYAWDACRRVAAEVAAAAGLDRGAVAVQRVPVAQEAVAVAGGTVDLGCSAVPPAPGSHLAASPPLAVSGVRLLTARLGRVSSMRDLNGGTVAVVAGTAAESVIRPLAASLSPPARVRSVPGPGDAFELVATGAADAWAADDLLLAGMLATRTDGPSFEVVGRPLFREEPVLLLRGDDPGFAALVRRAVERMRDDGTLRARYERWFTQPVPMGAALDRPASRETDAVLGGPPR